MENTILKSENIDLTPETFIDAETPLHLPEAEHRFAVINTLTILNSIVFDLLNKLPEAERNEILGSAMRRAAEAVAAATPEGGVANYEIPYPYAEGVYCG